MCSASWSGTGLSKALQLGSRVLHLLQVLAEQETGQVEMQKGMCKEVEFPVLEAFLLLEEIKEVVELQVLPPEMQAQFMVAVAALKLTRDFLWQVLRHTLHRPWVSMDCCLQCLLPQPVAPPLLLGLRFLMIHVF